MDLFSSGSFSRNGAGRFKGEFEAAIIFKTPSTADVLILELVTVCCLYFRSQFTSVTKCCGSHRTKSRGTSFFPCLFFTRHFVPRSPFGRRAVRQRGYGWRLLILKMANNKVNLDQIRSEEIIYSRFIKIPSIDIFQGETSIK